MIIGSFLHFPGVLGNEPSIYCAVVDIACVALLLPSGSCEPGLSWGAAHKFTPGRHRRLPAIVAVSDRYSGESRCSICYIDLPWIMDLGLILAHIHSAGNSLYGIITCETEAAGRDDPPRLFRQTYIFDLKGA